MAHRVVWSGRAIADVDAIATYIAANSPSYARTVVRNILMSTRSLAQFPFSGRIVPEVDDDSLVKSLPTVIESLTVCSRRKFWSRRRSMGNGPCDAERGLLVAAQAPLHRLSKVCSHKLIERGYLGRVSASPPTPTQLLRRKL